MGKGKVIFLKNAAILTVTSLLLRLLGMVFRVWLASFVGAEGMGLYQQIFSLYALVSVFAVSGVGLAVTRLVSEELTLHGRAGVSRTVGVSIWLTVIVAVLSGMAVFFGAEIYSVYIMSDRRAILSLKIMSFSLPFMGISAVLKGYFFARKKAFPNSSSQLIEQAVRIGFIITVFSGNSINTEYGAAVVFAGDLLAEGVAALYLTVCYLLDRRRLPEGDKTITGSAAVLKNLVRIVTPIASGKYLNSLLRTAENILVPASFRKYGLSSESALAAFGGIKGMALPLLLFPAGLLSSVTSLLIPEISESVAAGKPLRIRNAAERSISLTFLSSIPVAAIFFFAAEELTRLIYKDATVAETVKILSLLIPLMYIDSVSDALLKALDLQLVTFRHALFDSLGRIALITVLLPKFGVQGFLGVMYISNLYTSLANLRRLMRETGAKIDLTRTVIMPVLLSCAAGLFADFLAGRSGGSGLVYIMLLGGMIILSQAPLLSSYKKVYYG